MLVVRCWRLRRHPRGGSFLRPAKASLGVDYVTAVRRHYQMDASLPSEDAGSIEWRVKGRR